MSYFVYFGGIHRGLCRGMKASPSFKTPYEKSLPRSFGNYATSVMKIYEWDE